MAKKVCPNAERCDRDMPESTTVDTFFWKMKGLSLISLTFAPTIQKSEKQKKIGFFDFWIFGTQIIEIVRTSVVFQKK